MISPKPFKTVFSLRKGSQGIAAIALGSLLACGGGGGADTTSATSEDTLKQTVLEMLRSEYLWADSVPASVDPTLWTTASEMLDALKKSPIDRYSHIAQASNLSTLIDGKFTGFGVRLTYTNQTATIVRTFPGSPAQLAGLLRGDKIVAIDGVSGAEIEAGAGWDAALGSQTVGVSKTLTIERGSQRFDQSLSKAQIDYVTVQDARVLTLGSHRIAYLEIGAFANTTPDEFRRALQTISADNPTALVIDQRLNGGGLVDAIDDVAGALAQSTDANKTLFTLKYAPVSARGESVFQPALSQTPSLPDIPIVFISLEATCSAAEIFQASLPVIRPVKVIGKTSCGKPVGFQPRNVGDKTINIAAFSVETGNGTQSWFDGLVPDCEASEDELLPLGSPEEPLLKQAISWITDRNCASPQTKSARISAKSWVPSKDVDQWNVH